jgi:hypothetical protein
LRRYWCFGEGDASLAGQGVITCHGTEAFLQADEHQAEGRCVRDPPQDGEVAGSFRQARRRGVGPDEAQLGVGKRVSPPALELRGVPPQGGPRVADPDGAASGLQLAIGAACTNTLGRISRLCDPAFTGLHRFLAVDDSGQSGVIMLESVAAAAMGHIRASAQPVSLQTVVLSLGAEEDASFASVGAAQLDSTVRALSTIVGIELICAGRALRLQGRTPGEFSSARFRKALDAALSLPADVQDRDLRPDVDMALKLVRLPDLGEHRQHNTESSPEN